MHMFDEQIAKEYGILEAVLVNHFHFWIKKNIANGKHYHDGKYWTYTSIKGLAELLPYTNENKVRRALEKLRAEGVVEVGVYNQTAYDRTKWYTFTPQGWALLGENADGKKLKSNWQNCQIEDEKKPNRKANSARPIPDISTDNKTDKKTYRERFTPPSVEEVEKYCRERNNSIDAQRFVDFYSAKGWYIGKSKMKDWRACVRTWERRTEPKETKTEHKGFLTRQQCIDQWGVDPGEHFFINEWKGRKELETESSEYYEIHENNTISKLTKSILSA